MGEDRLYFRQLLSGRDFATTDGVAQQMVNFVYAIGDRDTGELVLVDPAYDVHGLLDLIEADDMRCVGVLATHYHPDHVGGSMMGMTIEGVSTLLERVSVPIHVQAAEAEFVQTVTGVSDTDLIGHGSGDVLSVGAVDIEMIHTPPCQGPLDQPQRQDRRLYASFKPVPRATVRADSIPGLSTQLRRPLSMRWS